MKNKGKGHALVKKGNARADFSYVPGHLGQGLGYSGDSSAKVLAKFCTPNGSPKTFWPHTKKIL